uniref:CCT domain-containing protein n=1 Tax=Leersia perrieri TaxID=77586 RepID=A0A0D9X5T3_9ORYZ
MASSGVYDHLFAASDDDAAASPWAATQASPNNNDSSSSFTTSDGAVAAGERSLFDLLSDVDIMSCGGGVAGVFDGASTHTISPPMWLHPGHLAAALTAWSPVDSAAAVVVPTNNASASAMAREERVRRYREKRKNRKFQKTIRYASRKAYAEARPRIKGRFVKRPAAAGAAASDDDSSATAAGVAPEEAKFWLSFSGDDARADGGVGFYMDNAAAAYGVVPTF